MKRILYFLNHPWLAIFACILVLTGMIFSRFLLSVGTILLFARAVIHPEAGRHFQLLWKHKDFLAIFSIFVLYLLSALWSEDTGFLVDRLRMKLPFLTMPVAFLSLTFLNDRLLNRLFYFLFWMVVIASAGTLLFFLMDFSEVAESYGAGQVMATPSHHIRFSIMAAFCVCIGIDFFYKNYFIKNRAERWWILGGTIFLITFLHILAVRSGLLALYCALLFYGIFYILKTKKYITGAVIVAVFFLTALWSYENVPTLKRKMDYTFYSIDLFRNKENLRDLSDSRRLASILASFEIAEQHPWLGVGIGDIKNETNKYLEENYPSLAGLGLMPHNQYLFVLTAAGIIGLLWFLTATFYPLFYRLQWKDSLFIAFNLIFFSSFIVEHTLETQVGTAIYIFPLLMMMRARSLRNNEEDAIQDKA